MATSSLRLRLTILFAAIALVVWLIAGIFSYVQTRHSLSEILDTQQMLFAQSLANTDLDTLSRDVVPRHLDRAKRVLRHGNRGEVDDDVMAFAVFDREGRLLLSGGDHGEDFPFESRVSGFVRRNLPNDDDDWRLLYISSVDRSFRVVVGQELEYRKNLLMKLLVGQLLPWLVALPFLMLAIAWMTHRELTSLRIVARELTVRRPDDATPITPERVPSETRPLVHALNTLFKRTTAMLTRERRFTADAAHELRTPLAALRVQAEVAQMADDDPAARNHALRQLMSGIDRATRLVEQLLALSRLDPLTAPGESQPVDWLAAARTALADVQPLAASRRIALSLDVQGTPPALDGNPTLLTLLLRNLLDNAARYTPEGGHVILKLMPDGIAVEDDGPGVAPEYLAQLRERFFRPPGQTQPGSGLGLSIVDRIASLHGLTLRLDNREEDGKIAGFVASLHFR